MNVAQVLSSRRKYIGWSYESTGVTRLIRLHSASPRCRKAVRVKMHNVIRQLGSAKCLHVLRYQGGMSEFLVFNKQDATLFCVRFVLLLLRFSQRKWAHSAELAAGWPGGRVGYCSTVA